MFQKMNKMVAGVLLLALFFSAASPAAADPSVTAKGAISIDYDSGNVLYEKDADTPRPVASMTKIMTAFLIWEGVASGRFQWDDAVPISEEKRAYAAEDPNGCKIKLNEQESLKDLTDLLLIISSNAAARILAEYVSGSEEAFVQEMNAKAQALGINAVYGDAAGLRWNAVTPRAVASLTRLFIERYPDVLDVTKQSQVTLNGDTFHSVNLLYGRLPFGGADGFKSGWMPFSGFCFTGTAAKDGGRVITTVVNAPAYEGSYRDTIQLFKDGFQKQSMVYPTSTWAQSDIDAATERGLSCQKERNGKAFEGRQTISRAEYVAILMKALSPQGPVPTEQPFTDIEGDAWYAPYVARAHALGVANGTGKTTFSPQAPITREQMAAFMAKALKVEAASAPVSYSDRNEISPSMRSAVDLAARMQLMFGDANGQFRPLAETTREEATIVILRLLRHVESGLLKNPIASEAPADEEANASAPEKPAKESDAEGPSRAAAAPAADADHAASSEGDSEENEGNA